ncbi:hypothetical protein HAHE_31570 [Haloferula helveola]|uniref:HTH gntR-type domain-containing protein n=1 Tax=Haloferula helveola TaxID=490095 RepID=A0ABN6H6S5_9BACT|nr:hypothetical protein HAHE_31570 [Haloferula helveola]
MPTLRVLTAAEQVADHLRKEIRSGTWTGTMPGGAALARELGVGRMTVDAALDLLEKQGELVSQGARLPRRVSTTRSYSSSLKVAFLPYLIEDYRFDYIMDLQRLLQEDGHTVLFPKTSITLMKGNMARITKLIETTQADAWIVVAGPREVLTWFSECPVPAFAMFGRRSGLPIAGIGPDKSPALRELARHFIELGHERITMLTRPVRRLPRPGAPERAFLDELRRGGIRTGSYNLPDWDGKSETLGNVVDSIFKLTPPTAIVLDEPPIFLSVQQHLARRGILAPQHVSLACTDWDPYFELQQPSVAHVLWDSRPWVRRIVRWVRNVSQGKSDLVQSLTKTKLVRGESIGRALSRRRRG